MNQASKASTDLLQVDSIVAHRYRVIRYMGDRGFGQVYEADDSAMDQRVALMRLDREFSHPRVRESFFETRSTAQVNDPRVTDLTDYGEDVDGRLFLVMAWLEQADALDQLIARDAMLPWQRIKPIVEQIAGALVAAHAAGVLHGGLEPSRVLLDASDGVHVVDFGLAPALTRPGGRPVTNVKALPGNVAYLSPEQLRGEGVDARSDIYALGAILWELVTGAPPFVGDPLSVQTAHLERALPELAARDAPAELEALLHLALAKDKDERLAAHEFLSLLEAMPVMVPQARLARPSKPAAPPPQLAKPAAAKPAAAAAPASQRPAEPAPREIEASPSVAIVEPEPAAEQPEPTRKPASTPPPAPGTLSIESTEQAGVHRTEAPTAPPRKRRLGKLELAIIAFLGIDLLIFAGAKLLGGKSQPESDTVVATDAPAPDPAPPTLPGPPPEPGVDEPAEAIEAPPPEPPKPTISLEEAIAAELPEPDAPGPTRDIAQSLSDKDFREAMVDARQDILAHCLDTRMRRTLKVSLKVAPNGEVEYARVVGELGKTQLGSCVTKRVYRIEFPPTREGGTHTYTLRLM